MSACSACYEARRMQSYLSCRMHLAPAQRIRKKTLSEERMSITITSFYSKKICEKMRNSGNCIYDYKYNYLNFSFFHKYFLNKNWLWFDRFSCAFSDAIIGINKITELWNMQNETLKRNLKCIIFTQKLILIDKRIYF